jgi:hypothetical protein
MSASRYEILKKMIISLDGEIDQVTKGILYDSLQEKSSLNAFGRVQVNQSRKKNTLEFVNIYE